MKMKVEYEEGKDNEAGKCVSCWFGAGE